jgi:hypothetical protein
MSEVVVVKQRVVNSYEAMEIVFDRVECPDGVGLTVTFRYPKDSPDKATIEFRNSLDYVPHAAPPASIVNEALRLFVDRHPFAFESPSDACKPE